MRTPARLPLLLAFLWLSSFLAGCGGGGGGGDEGTTYSLSVTVFPVGGGTVTGAGTYDDGATATLEAFPGTGYAFSQWTGDHTSTDNPLTLLMDGDKSLTAVFTPNAYTVTLASNIPGAGSVSGGGAHPYGEVVRIEAEAFPGYSFSQFDFSSGAVESTTDNPYDHTMSGDVTVTTSFRARDFAWTWMSGPSAYNQAGVYGTAGVANSANHPGAREGSTGWIDPSGDIWIQGGYSQGLFGTYYTDLWRYSSSNGLWTWMAGHAGHSAIPSYGSKGSFGATTHPGYHAFASAIATTDGKLWLFGGMGTESSLTVKTLNELWCFDPSLRQWGWLSGSSTGDQNGVYGSVGVFGASNCPGGRSYAPGWKDPTGDLWVFGGYGLGATGTGALNDLWRYRPSIGQWAWMGGLSSVNQAGVYGTLGVPSLVTYPGTRSRSGGTADAAGSAWIFGGEDASASERFNDLWRFDPGTLRWTWVAGSSSTNQAGAYGTLGVPDSANHPGGRRDLLLWTDSAGFLWLFGGRGYDSAGSWGPLLDLWRFDPATGQWAWMAGPSTIVTSQPSFGTQGVPGGSPGLRWGAALAGSLEGTVRLFGGYDGNSWSDLWKLAPNP